MKYKDGRTFKRKIGQARKSQSIYDNLGHPYDIKDNMVIFIGKVEKAYCLTKGKKYKIISANTLSKKVGTFYDYDLYERFKHKQNMSRLVDCGQYEDYFITIINDKGHKKQYSHIMFKKVEAIKNGK